MKVFVKVLLRWMADMMAVYERVYSPKEHVLTEEQMDETAGRACWNERDRDWRCL